TKTPRRIALASVAYFSFAASSQADIAKLSPRETIVFAHWDGWCDADGPTAKLARQVATRLAQETGFDGEQASQVVNLLIDLAPAKTGVGFFGVRDVEGEPVPDLAFVFQGVKDPDATIARFRAVIDEDEDFSATTVNGAPLTLWKPDEDVDLHLGAVDGILVFATSTTSAEKIVAGIRGKNDSLTTSEEFLIAGKQARRNSTTESCGLFIELRALVQVVETMVKREEGSLHEKWNTILEEVGVRDIKSLYWSHGRKDDVDQGTFFVHTEPDANRGIVRLYRQEPFDTAELAIVPQDAYWLKAGTLDLYAIWKEALRIIEAIEPDAAPQVESGAAMTQQMFGFSLTEDFLPTLGKSWVMYDAPVHGGLYITGAVLATRPKSTGELDAMVSRFVEVVAPFAEQGNAAVVKKSLVYDGQEIAYILIGNLPIPVALSWTAANDRMLMGLSPHTLAAAIPQFAKASERDSILSNSDIQTFRGYFPEKITGMSYVNTKLIHRLIYPLLQLLHTASVSYAASVGSEIEFSVLPPYAEYREGLRGVIGTSWHEQDGLYFGYAGDTGVLAKASGSYLALLGGILMPSIAEARYAGKRAVSMANVRQIAMACHTYAVENDDKFPDNLQQLIDAGIMATDICKSPFDESATDFSYTLVANGSTSAHPENVLVFETRGSGNRGEIIAAFADGHAESMLMDDFKMRLRATYERLGKLEELPAEYRD
ncbi:MAG: hypothetical protein AB7N71_09360, partial [Phycisphaerae bacterium]